MGLWTCVIAEDSDAAGCALLLDSVTMRPLAVPVFRNAAAAESFVAFAKRLDFYDLRSLGADTLDRIHIEWVKEKHAREAKHHGIPAA